MQAVFIIGEQRSGSNLLRLMLSQAGIAAPHPPHILKRLLPLEGSYGDLAQDANWHQLVEDVCTLVERNPVPWTAALPLDRAEIASRCRARTTVAIFGAVMDRFAEAQGADTWACKSMGYSHYVEEIEDYFDAPRYIYLHRDGRDVALSFSRAVVGEKHPYFVAQKWATLQRAAMAVRERVGDERLFTVCYEELIAEPEPVLRALCDFLGVPFRPQMMDFHRSSAAQSASGSSQLWQNVARPLMRNNSRKFLRGLSVDEIRICESVAGAELDALGYDRVFIESGDEIAFTAEQVAAFSDENDRLKAERRASMDAEDAERRAHQLAVLTSRVQYLDELTNPQKLALLPYLEEQHLEPGATFIEEGEVEEDLFFIVSGHVDVLDGKAVLATLARGVCVGEVGLLSSLPRTRTLRARTPTRLLRLSRVAIQHMMADHPALAAQLLWVIGQTLAERFAGQQA